MLMPYLAYPQFLAPDSSILSLFPNILQKLADLAYTTAIDSSPILNPAITDKYALSHIVLWKTLARLGERFTGINYQTLTQSVLSICQGCQFGQGSHRLHPSLQPLVHPNS